MNVRNRAIALLTCGVLAAGSVSATASAATAAPPISRSVAASAAVPAGASFSTVTDLGVAGSQTYLYKPSVLITPTPMLTPVLFVYADQGYESSDAAWEALLSNGLVELAERENAVLIVQNPVDDEWGQSDVTVYQDVLRYIWGGNTAASGKPALSFYRLDYMLGEGDGATFINQFMTQAPNVNRIAGVATFGGEMPDVAEGSALPAYIVGGSRDAIEYYKEVNDVDARRGATFYNTDNPAKEVIVDKARAQAFDRRLIKDAYDELFRYTARQGLSTPVFYDNATTTEDFTLMERPNLDELDLTQVLVTGADTGTTGQPRWYEWVPDEVLNQKRSKRTYPLVLDLHGRGDHEIYEAESNGWIELAGEEKVIVAAPFDTTTPAVMGMLEELKAKYPIDPSRIYMTGFSAGGRATWLTSSLYPEVFAAIAPMSSPGSTIDPSLAAKGPTVDLPTFFSAATNERDAVLLPSPTNPIKQVKVSNLNALTTYMALNEVAPPTSFDFSAHGIFGFPIDEPKDYVTRWGFTVSAGTLSDPDGVPLMEIATGQNLDHTHYMDYAPIAWDYMSQFQRKVGTGEVIYEPSSELPALSALDIGGSKGSKLTPEFDSDHTHYALEVDRRTTSVELKAKVGLRGASVSIAGDHSSRGSVVERVKLGAPGSTTAIEVAVVAENGIELVYRVEVHRAD